MRRAVFLDRDGTVNEEVGYLSSLDALRLFPQATQAIHRLNQAGIAVVIVTNQSGVARGYVTESLIHQIHDKLRAELARRGAFLDAIYYCPHHPEGVLPEYRQACECRKPAPGMLRQAAAECDFDLPSSFVVGDKYQDVEAGFRAGARSVLVLTGYGKQEYSRRDEWPRQPDHVADDLVGAIEWILGQIHQ